MTLPNHKTKIVSTIGPASNSPEMLENLIRAGMNIARLNFSHGTFDQHAEVITRIRTASRTTGRRVAIMGDLPGPKMRVGTIEPDPIYLTSGDSFTLTSEQLSGNARRVSINATESSRFSVWAPATLDYIKSHYRYVGTYVRNAVYVAPSE